MRTLRPLVFISISLAAIDAHAQASLAGKLTVGESPLAACTISLYRLEPGQKEYTENIVTRTADDGSYRFPSLAPGSYFLLGACGGQRVFQGKVDVGGGENTRDVSLPDPFVGRWRLNIGDSIMGDYRDILEEVREYTGTKMSWRRVLSGGAEQRGTYDTPCDGKEYESQGTRGSCRCVGPETIEGLQKPPLRYFVSKVAGDRLTFSRYTDAAHTQLTEMLVFDRVQ
jgi:hypothetical protein